MPRTTDPAIRAYVKQLVDKMPPLTEQQKDVIRAAFRGGRT